MFDALPSFMMIPQKFPTPLSCKSGVGRLISRLKTQDLTAVACGIGPACRGGEESTPARHKLGWLTCLNGAHQQPAPIVVDAIKPDRPLAMCCHCDSLP